MRVTRKAFLVRHVVVSTRATGKLAHIAARLAIGLGMPAALAQAPAASTRAAATTPAPAAEEQPVAATRGGPHESVKVHGHWVIEVRNPDGSMAQRHEFENALQSSAAIPISSIFLGGGVVGGWQVTLDPESAGGAPCGPGGSCVLKQAQLTSECSSNCSSNLTAAGANFGEPVGSPGGVSLTGWIQASRPGNIAMVQTQIFFCGVTSIAGLSPISLTSISPSQCAATPDSFKEFTAATLPLTNSSSHPCGLPGENSCEITGIKANQMINVSVTITFQ